MRHPLARLALWSLLLFTACAATLHAQVKATLVAREAAIQPGTPFTVALRLVHDKHWHTYWINPGTGYPTSLTWDLPPGWSASEITWPTPQLLKDRQGNITGHGYEGEVFLPVTLTPPADLPASGPRITLKAKAAWLMCNESCVPGNSSVQLTLPVSATPSTNTTKWGAPIDRTPFPKADPSRTVTASVTGKTITLTVSDPANTLTDAHFFGLDELIQYDAPQPATAQGDLRTFSLPISASFEGPPRRLTGVITFGNPKNDQQGLLIDLPLGPIAAANSKSFNTRTPSLGSDSSTPASTISLANLLPTLALAFFGGLILNLMPCVFPVLGIKILGFVNQAGSDRRKVTLHGLVFTLGVLLSFWSLAALLTVLRSGGSQLGWGFQLQSPEFVFLLAAIMLVFALNMSGVFEFALRATSVGASLQTKSGFLGSFFTGVLATVVATPCSAPFLATALGAALTLSTAASFAIFTAIALGLSTPYLVLSLFPSAVRILPRPGAWMETFKQAMAFPLYATVAYLVWVLAGQISDAALLNTLLGLTVIAMAAWLYGRYTAPGSKPQVNLAFIGGAALLATGTFIAWPRAAQPDDLVWEKWSPAAVTSAQISGKTIYVDFTARWCATCQANKKIVFNSSEVKTYIREKKIVLLKADWTNHDDAITAELARFGRSAVPCNLVYKPGLNPPKILPELLTPTIVLEALR